MFVVESVVDIDRPVPEVFDFVADMTNAPLWQAGLSLVQRTPPGPVRVGSEHVFERRFAGRALKSRNRITAFQPPSRIAFEIPDGSISGRAAYEVTPTAGGSRVSCRMEFRAAGPGRLLEPLLARLLKPRQPPRRSAAEGRAGESPDDREPADHGAHAARLRRREGLRCTPCWGSDGSDLGNRTRPTTRRIRPESLLLVAAITRERGGPPSLRTPRPVPARRAACRQRCRTVAGTQSG